MLYKEFLFRYFMKIKRGLVNNTHRFFNKGDFSPIFDNLKGSKSLGEDNMMAGLIQKSSPNISEKNKTLVSPLYLNLKKIKRKKPKYFKK